MKNLFYNIAFIPVFFKLKFSSNKTKKGITFSNDETCHNCGTPLNDRYCSHCGQDRLSGFPLSFMQIIGDFFYGFFTDRVWNTVIKLLFRPGFLSKEYISGRIESYSSPFKMFWTTVLAFTLIFSFVDNSTFKLVKNKEKKQSQQIEQIENKQIEAKENIIKEEIVLLETEAKNEIKDEKNISDADNEIKGSVSDYLQYLPYFILLVMPIFASLLMLFFRKEKYAFSEQLIFTTHLHTVIFFILTLRLLINSVLSNVTLGSCFEVLVIFLIFLYPVLSAIKFYDTRKKWSVIFRIILIELLYFIVFIITFISVLIIVMQFFNISEVDWGEGIIKANINKGT